MSTSEAKKLCHTPTPGKAPTRIPAWKYDLLRARILALVPLAEPGLAASALPDLVAQQLDDDARDRLGSVGWHVTTVRLNMEVEGELVRLPKVKPLHLIRGAAA